MPLHPALATLAAPIRPPDLRRHVANSKIARNLGWKTLGTVVEKLLKLALIPIIARSLGPRVYGQFNYALGIAAMFVQLTDLGLGIFLAREIARHDEPPRRLIGQVLTLKAVLAVGYLGLIGLLAWWHLVDPRAGEDGKGLHPGALAFTVAILGLASLGVSAVESIWQVFRGVQRLELEAASSSFFALAQLVFVVAALAVASLLWPDGSDLSMIMVMIAAGMAMAGMAGATHAAWLMRQVVSPHYGWSTEALGRFRREVLPLGVAIVASFIYFKLDVVLLRHFVGDEETGWYSAAYKPIEYMGIIPATLLAATFPALSQTVLNDPQRAWRLHRNSALALAAAGVVGTLVLVTIPEFIIGTLVGPEFGPSATMLRWLAPSVLLTMLNCLETHMLVALGRVKSQMVFTLVLIGINLGTNWLLIPKWGGVGAAISTWVTELVLFAFCAPLVYRELKLRLALAPVAAG
ncbi:MAG: flippase [Myxococcales bacterium]|nr:flippase [Myxococcales bacterium]